MRVADVFLVLHLSYSLPSICVHSSFAKSFSLSRQLSDYILPFSGMCSGFLHSSALFLILHIIQIHAVDPPYIRFLVFQFLSSNLLTSEDFVTTWASHSSLGLALILKDFSQLFSSQTCRFPAFHVIGPNLGSLQVHSLKSSGGTDMQFLYQA